MFFFLSLCLFSTVTPLVDQQDDTYFDVGPWLFMGPFAHKDPTDLTEKHPPLRFLPDMQAGEAWDPQHYPVEVAGKLLSWKSAARARTSFDTGYLNLAALTECSLSKQAAFLYCPIRSDTATEQTVYFGSDDGFIMWLNGERIAESNRLRATNPYEESVVLNLASGLNHLLIEVTQEGSAWSFQMLTPTSVDTRQVNHAISDGVTYLLGRQLLDGSWENKQARFRNGATALAVYTLLSSGIPSHHPAIQRGIEFLRTQPSTQTYSIGCELMALAALGDPQVTPWMERRVATLLSWQKSNGTWAYPDGQWDLSCTQFAVLGLRAAANRGIDIPSKVWKNAIRGALVCQQPKPKKKSGISRAFTYYPGHTTYWTGSMTSAGVAILAIAKEQMGNKLKARERDKVDAAIEAGVAWMAKEFSVGANPHKDDGSFLYYWLYGVERIGALLNIDRYGRHEWYAQGSSYLVSRQHTDGAWTTQWGDQDTSTCFSLLFLRRATAAPVLTSSRKTDNFRHHSTDANKNRLVIHATEGDPIVLWTVPPDGVILRTTNYFARRPEQEWQPIGAGEGKRFAHRFTASSQGIWEFRVEGISERGKKWESDVLSAKFETGIRSEELDYASDSSRNRMPSMEPEVTISSQAGSASGDRLVDNAWWSFWECDPTDLNPTVEIKLRKKSNLKRILFSQAHTRSSDYETHPRITQIEVWLNQEKESTLYSMAASPGRKTILDFPKGRRVNHLRIRIVSIAGGELGQAAIGFSEIELQ